MSRGAGGLPASSFPPPSPFPLPASPFNPSTTTLPCTPFYLPPAQKPPAVCKAQTAPTPKQIGLQGVPSAVPSSKEIGVQGGPSAVSPPNLGFGGGVSHALLPPAPSAPQGRAGSVRAKREPQSPLHPQGSPLPFPSSPRVLCPLLGVAGPWGPPRPPCSSVVPCCSFRCL